MAKYILGGLGLMAFGLGLQPYITALQPYSLYLIFGGLFVFFLPVLIKLFRCLSKARKFTFPTAGGILSLSHLNNPDAFPRLSISALERFAERWIKMFSNIPITSIKLYRKHPQLDPEFQPDLNINSIYAVVFEVRPEVNLSPKIKEEYKNFMVTLAHLWIEDNIENFDDLGIDRSFSEVYKEKPRNDDFMKDWFFISKTIDDEDSEASILNMKIIVNEPHWILYKKST